MLASEVRRILNDRFLSAGIGALAVGQLLYSIFDVGFVWVLALVYVLAIGLPYPKVLRSFTARALTAFVLVFGFVQFAATAQFYIARDTHFGVLSLLTTILVIGVVAVCYRWRASEKRVWFERKDVGALVAAAFFVIPLAVWTLTPVQITSFGGLQSPDGSAHNAGINEMGAEQHLTYRTNPNYYPKGFHITEALLLDGFHALQRDQSWSTNTRVYVAQYLIWGFVVAAMLYYLARQLAEWLLKKPGDMLLAVLVGLTLSLFYLLPFAQEGFLNYYYICASFAVGLLLLPAFALKTREDHWFVAAYFMIAFGISMSWGPLLLPVLAVPPALYMILPLTSVKDAKRHLLQKKNWTVWAGFIALLVPLYIHFKYSHSTSFNAEGSIRVFNIGLLLAGVGLLAYAVFSDKLAREVKHFIASVFWPYVLLVAGLAAAQYLTVGMPRYYTIKTSYLFEMIIVVVLAVLFVRHLQHTKLVALQKWLLGGVLFCIGIFMLLCLGGNPVTSLRGLLNRPAFLKSDTQKMTDLGQKGLLRGSNNAVLHYDPSRQAIFGNELIANWANGQNPNNDGTPESAACNGTIYATLVYGAGQDQQKLVEALKTCIDLGTHGDKNYYIITDPESLPNLKRILGDKAIFL